MKLSRSFSRCVLIAVALCALGFVVAVDYARVQRVRAVTALGAEDARSDLKSATGWADGKRWLLLAGPVPEAGEAIQLTQQMLSAGEWRIRHIDYENAPTGRDVYSASHYRWWLAALAKIDHAISGRPQGQSVERAALVADPLLHLFLLAAAGLFAARRFGAGAASLLMVGLATLFPFASAFIPAVATDHGLAQICLFWSALILVADLYGNRASRTAYFLAGAAGGLALWLSVTASVPFLLATVIGGILATLAGRQNGANHDEILVPPWRAWGVGGALACLFGYGLEYFPHHVSWDLRVNHPLFGLAWLGIAELLQRFARKVRTGNWSTNRSELLVVVGAFVACASVVVALSFVKDWQFIGGDLFSTRLSNLSGSPVAENFADWLKGAPAKTPLIATLVPVLLFGFAALQFFARKTAVQVRIAIGLGLGPALVTLGLSFLHLRWWTSFDGAALILVAPLVAGSSRTVRWICGAITVVACAIGLVELWPGPALQLDRPDLTHDEVRGLYERGLAHWIVDHTAPDTATVLASPLCTSSFCFYGSLRGLGTAGWQNRDGLSASYRVASSSRTEDTLALLNKDGVNYIVLPSWDTALETMASLGVEHPTDSFVSALHQTAGAVFPWLRPLPYSPPAVAGFEDSSVLVFRLTDEANPAVVRSRTLEYLIEMHRLDQAATANGWLQRYPADVGAQVAITQYAKATGNEEEFARVFKSVVSYVQVGADRRLPWDRRISLAVVLAIGGRKDLSRVQAERCLGLLNEQRVRELTTGSLYHFLVLLRNFGLEIPDPKTRELATTLLPPELRERL